MSKHSESHFLKRIKQSFSGAVNTRSIVAIILFGMIVTVFVLSDLSGRAGGKGGSVGAGSAASVNGTLISLKQFQDQENRMMAYFSQLYGGKVDNEFQRKQIQSEALNQLVNSEVAYQGAHNEKVIATDAEVQKAILDMPNFKRDGVFQTDLYKNLLSANRLTPAEFEKSLRQQVAVQKVQNLFDMALKSSALEKNAEADLKAIQINMDYVQLNTEMFNNDKIISSNFVQQELKKPEFQQKVEEYYKKNSAEFETPEQVKASHILIKAKSTEEETMKIAESIYTQALKGDFGQLAKKYSEDPGSQSKNGDLGYFSKGRMVKEFEDVAFGLKVGEVSKVFKSPFGYHIMKVTDKKPLVKMDQKLAFEKIGRQMLAESRLSEVTSLLEKQLKDGASVDELVRQNQLAWKETGYFDLNQDVLPPMNSTALLKAALELNVKNNVTKSLIRDGDSQYILKFKDLKKNTVSLANEQLELAMKQKSFTGFQSWVEAHKKTSKIELNTDLLK